MAVSSQTIKSEEIIPPYYDRYLDEREKRFVTELNSLHSDIKVNAQSLANRIENTNKRMEDFKDYVEMRFDETNKRVDETNNRIDELRDYVIVRFDETNKRIDELRDYVIVRFDETNKRIDETNKRIDGLEKKIDHHFYWTIALFAPFILSIIGGIIAILFRTG